jgi:uncharacterized membrane protein (GlpM family)
MDMIWKGIGGGLVTAAIVGLSRRGDTLPGILPLSPGFALIALLIVGAKRDGAGFRRAWHLPGLVLDLTTIAIPWFCGKFAVACDGARR